MRIAPLVLSLALGLSVSGPRAAGVGAMPAPDREAQAAAVADGASTLMVLGSGGFEMNPMVPTSPIGILGITAVKVGLARHLDRLPPEERNFGLKCTTSIWGGAAVNNLLALTPMAPPLALAAGLIAGVAFWRRAADQIEAQAQAQAALAAQAREVQALFADDAQPEAEGLMLAAD